MCHLIGINGKDIIADITGVMSSEIKVCVVGRSKYRILIGCSLISDKESPVLEPAVEYICIEVTREAACSVGRYIVKEHAF